MQTVKVQDLTSTELDYAIAKCEGLHDGCEYSRGGWLCWVKCGPIIERERLSIVYRDLGNSRYWSTEILGGYQGLTYVEGQGSTPLIAAMRCYVESKLGAEIEIPEDL